MEKKFDEKKFIALCYQVNNALFERIKIDTSNKPLPINKKKNQNLFFLKNFEEQKVINKMEEENTLITDFNNLELIDNITLNQISKRLDQITPNYITRSQIDQLFIRQKKEQEQKIVKRRQQLEKKYASFKYNQIPNSWRLDYQNSTIMKSDLQTLNINRDLNDAVVNFFLYLIKSKMIPPQLQLKIHSFNTYFMSKLIGSDLKDEKYIQKIAKIVFPEFEKKVQQNYSEIRRWTKNTDIFQKDFIVIPVNIPNHWNLMMILYPSALVKKSDKKPSIIYMDSFGEKNKSLIQAIRIYLRKQLADKKLYQNPNSIEINQFTLPDYQFFLPRQTNYHDCGLYLLTFVQSLLLNPQELDMNFEQIKNRQKLKLFPRSLIFTMRMRITDLYLQLSKKDSNIEKLIQQYLQRRKQIIQQSKDIDYDQINQKQFQKYLAVNNKQKIFENSEEAYSHKLAFYIKTDFNFFQSSYHYEK